MHRRFGRNGRILNCRTGVEPDTRCLTGTPEKIDRAKGDFFALGPLLLIDNVLLILKKGGEHKASANDQFSKCLDRSPVGVAATAFIIAMYDMRNPDLSDASMPAWNFVRIAVEG